MGVFGGPPKAVKTLNEQLDSARITMGLIWKALPEDRRKHACEQVPRQIAEAARAAAGAGQREAALAALDAAAQKPPASEPAEMSWASVIEAGRAALYPVHGADPRASGPPSLAHPQARAADPPAGQGFCPGCGAPWGSEEDRFCRVCGRPRPRTPLPRCPTCGAELSGVDRYCGACGAPANAGQADVPQETASPTVSPSQRTDVVVGGSVPPPTQGSSSVGTAGFILVIIGLFVPLLGVVGLVLSVVGYRGAKREGRPPGLALPGTIIGAIATVTGIAILAVLFGLGGVFDSDDGSLAGGSLAPGYRESFVGSWMTVDGLERVQIAPQGSSDLTGDFDNTNQFATFPNGIVEFELNPDTSVGGFRSADDGRLVITREGDTVVLRFADGNTRAYQWAGSGAPPADMTR